MSRKNKFHTKFRPHFIAGMLTFLVIAAGVSFAIAYFHRADNTFKTRMILMLAGYGVLIALMLISFFWIYVARKEIETTYINLSEEGGSDASTRDYRKAVLAANEKNIKKTSYNFEQWMKRVYNPKIREIQFEIKQKNEELNSNPSQVQVIYQDIFSKEAEIQNWENDARRYQEAIDEAKNIWKELKNNSTATINDINSSNTQISQYLDVFNTEQSEDKIFSREKEAQRVERLKTNSRNQSSSVGKIPEIRARKPLSALRKNFTQNIDDTVRKIESMDPLIIGEVITNINDISATIVNEIKVLEDSINDFLTKCSCQNLAQFVDRIMKLAEKFLSESTKETKKLKATITSMSSNSNPSVIIDLYEDVKALDDYYDAMRQTEEEYRSMLSVTDDIMNQYKSVRSVFNSEITESNRLIFADDNKQNIDKILLSDRQKVETVELLVSKANADDQRVKKTSEFFYSTMERIRENIQEVKEWYERKFIGQNTLDDIKNIRKSQELLVDQEKDVKTKFEEVSRALIILDDAVSKRDSFQKTLSSLTSSFDNSTAIFLSNANELKDEIDKEYKNANDLIKNNNYDDVTAEITAEATSVALEKMRGVIDKFADKATDDYIQKFWKKRMSNLGVQGLYDKASELNIRYTTLSNNIDNFITNVIVSEEQNLIKLVDNAKGLERGNPAGENVTNYIERVTVEFIRKIKSEYSRMKRYLDNKRDRLNDMVTKMNEYINPDKTQLDAVLNDGQAKIRKAIADMNAKYDEVKESVIALNNIVKLNEEQAIFFD